MNYGFNNFTRATFLTKRWVKGIIKFFEIQKKIDWKNYINDTVVIHLSGRSDRYDKIIKRTSSQKLKKGATLLDHIRIFDAVDGSKLKRKSKKIHIDKYDFKYHWIIDPNPWMQPMLHENPSVVCSDAEIGIAHSHYKIWKEIVKKKTPVTLIMEDDFEFAPGFQKKIKDIFENELPEKWDLLYLSSLPGHTGFTWDPESKNLLRLYNGVWWLSGYVLTYEGAKTLLNNSPVVGPVDVWINHQFKDLNVYMTKHNLIEQADDTPSDNTYSFPDKFGY